MNSSLPKITLDIFFKKNNKRRKDKQGFMI
jgi:hypothetical protein